MKFRRRPQKDRALRVKSRAASEWQKIYPDLREDPTVLCRLLNFEPTWQQKDVIRIVRNESQLPPDRRLKRIAIKSGQGPGKCQRAHMRVFDLSSGRMRTIGELVEQGEGFTVPAKNEKGQIVEAEARAFPSGEKPCVKVILDTGQELEMSTDHPIWTPKGWVEAQDLKVGGLVGTARHLPDPGQHITISDRDLIVLAYLMSDGNCSNNTPRFSQMPGPVLEEMKSLTDLRFANRCNYRVCGSQSLLRKWGLFGHTAKTKRVPQEFFGLSQRQIGLFINRFWACDGYFTKDGPEITLANKELIQDLQALLLRLGILSRFSYKASKCNGKAFDAWRLRINGHCHDTWKEKVGEVLGKEGRMPSIRTGKYAHLANDDIFWAKVKEVKPTGTHPVFDLEVPEYGNFVTEGVVVHNTALSVVIMVWRVLLGVDALGIVTAPTMVQAKDVWLGTCRKMMNKAHPLLRSFVKPTKSRVLIGGMNHPDWSIQLMAASRPENTQGRHDKYLTFLEEEASGIEDEIDEQIKGTLTNENSLLIKIGNPNFRDVHFFDAFNSQRDEYHTYTMNAEESPLVDQNNVEKIAKEYGRDSDVFRVRVLGEFPSENPNSVLSSDDLEACARLDPVLWAKKSPAFRQFGFDLARFGGDENTVYQRKGQAIIDHKIKRGCEPVEILRAGMHMERVCGWRGDSSVRWVIDADGIGQGALHVAYEGTSSSIVEFHSGSSKVRDPQFANQLSEAWWHTRDLVRSRDLAIPNDPVLIKQLSDRHYTLNKAGQILVESKKDWLRRKGLSEGAGNSPDRADGFVMSNYRFGISPGRAARKKGVGKRIGPRIRR